MTFVSTNTDLCSFFDIGSGLVIYGYDRWPSFSVWIIPGESHDIP
jgi:hypothetical protein